MVKRHIQFDTYQSGWKKIMFSFVKSTKTVRVYARLKKRAKEYIEVTWHYCINGSNPA